MPTTQPVTPRFSKRTQNLRPSPIRETLAVVNQPGMVSFAGGLPAMDSFPQFDLHDMPADILQYGASEGEWELRQHIAADLAERGLHCTAAQILILSGSQQGIDLVGKLFIDADTPVAVESPTYLAALQVFRFFGADFMTYQANALELAAWQTTKPAFAYAIPTFQNPSGHCLNAAERDALAAACDASHTTLFEDDPYRDLVYDTCERTPVCARLTQANWIYQGSFSKSLAPGLRLGYLAASPELIPLLTGLKQAADLHSNRIGQWLVLKELTDPNLPDRMAALAASYRQRRNAFAAALTLYFADLASWEIPPGGLFFWLTLNRCIDTRLLLPKAIAAGVAFMPGEFFLPFETNSCGQLRLNFSHATEAEAARGLQILAKLIRDFKD